MTNTSSIDPMDMLGAVRGLPDQIDDAWARVKDLRLPDAYRNFESVALAGMGGSAIGGDLAASLFADRLSVPLYVVRDYRLPGWVSPKTLVIASSYSGNTEETLAAYDDATSRGCRRVVITSGGVLQARAAAEALPLIAVPPGHQPRAAVGGSLASVLGVLHAAGVLDDPGAALDEGTAAMRALLEGVDREGIDHPASRLAESFDGRIPFVYAPEDLAPVALRWKDQLNENGKTTAAWDVLPELNHNAVVGYDGPPSLGAAVYVVTLTAPGTHERTSLRIAITNRLLADAGVPHDTIVAPAGSRAAQALWLILMGDLVSVLLAFRRGIDPTPVDAITRLKALLEATPSDS